MDTKGDLEIEPQTYAKEMPKGVLDVNRDVAEHIASTAIREDANKPATKKKAKKKRKKIKREGYRRPWFDEDGLYQLQREESEWKLIRLTEGIDMALGNETNSKEVLGYTSQDFFDKDDDQIMKEVYMTFPQLLDFWKIDDPEYVPKRWDTGKCFWRYFHPRPSEEYIQMIHDLIAKRDEEKNLEEINNNK